MAIELAISAGGGEGEGSKASSVKASVLHGVKELKIVCQLANSELKN